METLITNDLFRIFLRINFRDIKITDDESDAINIEFSKYLQDKCNEKQLKNFVPESEVSVMLQVQHPLMMNGFNPAFMFHFTEFIDKQKE